MQPRSRRPKAESPAAEQAFAERLRALGMLPQPPRLDSEPRIPGCEDEAAELDHAARSIASWAYQMLRRRGHPLEAEDFEILRVALESAGAIRGRRNMLELERRGAIQWSGAEFDEAARWDRERLAEHYGDAEADRRIRERDLAHRAEEERRSEYARRVRSRDERTIKRLLATD